MTANDYTPGQKDWLAYDSKSDAPPRQYSGHESVFAWLCMLAGYLVCRIYKPKRRWNPTCRQNKNSRLYPLVQAAILISRSHQR